MEDPGHDRALAPRREARQGVRQVPFAHRAAARLMGRAHRGQPAPGRREEREIGGRQGVPRDRRAEEGDRIGGQAGPPGLPGPLQVIRMVDETLQRETVARAARVNRRRAPGEGDHHPAGQRQVVHRRAVRELLVELLDRAIPGEPLGDRGVARPQRLHRHHHRQPVSMARDERVPQRPLAERRDRLQHDRHAPPGRQQRFPAARVPPEAEVLVRQHQDIRGRRGRGRDRRPIAPPRLAAEQLLDAPDALPPARRARVGRPERDRARRRGVPAVRSPGGRWPRHDDVGQIGAGERDQPGEPPAPPRQPLHRRLWQRVGRRGVRGGQAAERSLVDQVPGDVDDGHASLLLGPHDSGAAAGDSRASIPHPAAHGGHDANLTRAAQARHHSCILAARRIDMATPWVGLPSLLPHRLRGGCDA